MSDDTNAEIFLQWKGTDACFDFHCPCGNSDHIDADFAYYVRCLSCGQVYEMPTTLHAAPTTADDSNISLVVNARADGWEENTVTHQTGSPPTQKGPGYILFDFNFDAKDTADE